MTTIPEHYRHLTEAPLFAHLATVRPDGTAQSNPMWFKLVGDQVHFTHTSKRQKYRNLQANPSMSISITDPEHPATYVELRGRLIEAEPDPTGAFYVELQQWYGSTSEQPPPDAADRVILKMSIDRVSGQRH